MTNLKPYLFESLCCSVEMREFSNDRKCTRYLWSSSVACIYEDWPKTVTTAIKCANNDQGHHDRKGRVTSSSVALKWQTDGQSTGALKSMSTFTLMCHSVGGYMYACIGIPETLQG